jgi:hypothetical protein
MARKQTKPNAAASIFRLVAKHGLHAHLFYNGDGSVAAVKISKPISATTEETTEDTSDDLRKLL